MSCKSPDENICVTTCIATADDIASTVLGPELKAALLEGWNYAMSEVHGIAAYLQIVGEQPQPESE